MLALADRARAKQTRPNILLLFADQHRADVMGCAGNRIVQTPVMDALARSGTRFSRAYCQDGICVASRTSMITGLYPRTTGILDNPDGRFLSGSEKMVPLQRHLRNNGYRTGCLGKRHLPQTLAGDWDQSATTINPAQDPSDENYDDWIKTRGQLAEHERDWGKSGKDSSFKADLMCQISRVKDGNRKPDYVSQKTIEFLRSSKQSGQPFFCWSSFIFPHQPYVPSPKWAKMYPSEQMPLPKSWDEPVGNVPPGLRNWRKNTKVPWNCGTAAENPGIYKRYIAYYYALVSEVDYHMGVILNELKRLGMADNTIVIYASDHGDFVASHGMVEKAARFHNIYEETLAVPLIVSWPKRFKGGQVCNGLAELVDLYPTLLELTGLPAPKDSLPMPGRSLVQTLETGKAIGRQYAVSENWSQATVITDRYKFGKWIDPFDKEAKFDFRGQHPDMLFDRKNDPLEVKNQIGKTGKVEKELRTMLAEWEEKTSTSGRETVLANWRKKGGRKP